MMPGIRTPLNKTFTSANSPNKSPNKTMEEAGHSTNVRRSVGEWETGKGEQTKLNSSVKTAANVPKQKVDSPKSALTNKTLPPIAIAIEMESPTDTNIGARNPRIAEARKCLVRVKQQLTLSKNIKKEIKEDIKSQVDRLYDLVKEAVMEKGRGPLTNKSVAVTTEAENPPVLPSPLPHSMCRSEEGKIMEFEGTLRKMLEEHGKKIAENNDRMDRLKEALRTSQENIEQFSYAGAAASQPGKLSSRHTALHSIAVTTKDEDETGDDVLNKIRTAVNAKEEWIKVERVRKAKNRKVIMSFETKDDRDKVKERLKKNGTDLTVEEVKNRDPLLILRDVFLITTDEGVLRGFRNQNPGVFHGLDDEANRMEIKYRKKARNPHAGHIVLSVSPSIWQRATAKGWVYIDLQRVRAEDQSPLVQCSLCLGYGHSRRLCTETTERCSHCAGPHLKKDCADWLAGSTPVCCNCTHGKLEKTDHNAFSSDCVVRKRWDEIARTAVAYC